MSRDKTQLASMRFRFVWRGDFDWRENTKTATTMAPENDDTHTRIALKEMHQTRINGYLSHNDIFDAWVQRYIIYIYIYFTVALKKINH